MKDQNLFHYLKMGAYIGQSLVYINFCWYTACGVIGEDVLLLAVLTTKCGKIHLLLKKKSGDIMLWKVSVSY